MASTMALVTPVSSERISSSDRPDLIVMATWGIGETLRGLDKIVKDLMSLPEEAPPGADNDR